VVEEVCLLRPQLQMFARGDLRVAGRRRLQCRGSGWNACLGGLGVSVAVVVGANNSGIAIAKAAEDSINSNEGMV
jgi:hypothetical protein